MLNWQTLKILYQLSKYLSKVVKHLYQRTTPCIDFIFNLDLWFSCGPTALLFASIDDFHRAIFLVVLGVKLNSISTFCYICMSLWLPMIFLSCQFSTHWAPLSPQNPQETLYHSLRHNFLTLFLVSFSHLGGESQISFLYNQTTIFAIFFRYISS